MAGLILFQNYFGILKNIKDFLFDILTIKLIRILSLTHNSTFILTQMSIVLILKENPTNTRQVLVQYA